MTDYINKNVPVANGITTPYGGNLYPWMSIKAGFESEFAEIRMRGPIYSKNGIELTPGGGPGGVDELSDIGNVNDSAKINGSILIYNTATSEWESKGNMLIDDIASIVYVDNDKIMFQRKDGVAGDFTALLKAWGINTDALLTLENSNGATVKTSCDSDSATIKFTTGLTQLTFKADNTPLVGLLADGRLTCLVPAYTPTFDEDYATKKYVDDTVLPSDIIISGGYEFNTPFGVTPNTYVKDLPLSGVITPDLSTAPLIIHPLSNFTCSPSGALTYTGLAQVVVHVDISQLFSWKKFDSNTSLEIQTFYLNAGVNGINQSGIYSGVTSSPNNVTDAYRVYSSSLSTVITLNPGDVVTVQWQNGTNPGASTATKVLIQSLSVNITKYG